MILFIPAPEDPPGFDIRMVDRELTIGPGGTLTPLELSDDTQPVSGLAWLVPWRAQESAARGVVLLSRPGVLRVNGRPVLPLTVLQRGDEIRIDGASLFFLNEAPLSVVPYSPTRANGLVSASGECTRCRGSIQPGDPTVSCPSCGSLYMAQTDRSPNCWEFGPCLCCGRDPKLAFSWQPRSGAPVQSWQSRPWRAAIKAAPSVSPAPSPRTGGSE